MATDGNLSTPESTTYTKRKLTGFRLSIDGPVAFIEWTKSTDDEGILKQMPPIVVEGGPEVASLLNAICGVGSGGSAAFRSRLRLWLENNKAEELG